MAALTEPSFHLSAEHAARTLWMGDLAFWMDESYLLGLFQATGQLRSVKVIRNKATGKSEGYGFIEFATNRAAESVLRTYNGCPIPNTDQVFRLNWATFGVGKLLAEGGGPDHSVFVGDLAPDVTDYVLQENFRQFFPSVRSAKVITDPLTGRSKGYGFVRFGSEAERDRALGDMMGHLISNRPIRVSIATAKKNPPGAPSANAASSNAPHPSDFDLTNTTLFIGGLSASVTEDELHSLFGRFGDIIYVKIPPGKGCGFVQYVLRPVAEVAMATMQSQVLGGSAIRISWGRSSAASRGGATASAAAAAAAATAYSQYQAPSAYGQTGVYPGYDAAAYGSYPSVAGSDPYGSAYGSYAAPQQQQPPTDLTGYQQVYRQGPYGALGPGALLGGAAGAGGVAQGGAGGLPTTAGLAKPELLDPLAAVDVQKLNAAYMQRHQGPLLGSHMRP